MKYSGCLAERVVADKKSDVGLVRIVTPENVLGDFRACKIDEGYRLESDGWFGLLRRVFLREGDDEFSGFQQLLNPDTKNVSLASGEYERVIPIDSGVLDAHVSLKALIGLFQEYTDACRDVRTRKRPLGVIREERDRNFYFFYESSDVKCSDDILRGCWRNPFPFGFGRDNYIPLLSSLMDLGRGLGQLVMGGYEKIMSCRGPSAIK
jgi:hypothetical protein